MWKTRLKCGKLSRSLRARGLKYGDWVIIYVQWYVALFTGAWIEILGRYLNRNRRRVALFTGAWIEISDSTFTHVLDVVALFTGAWIEILLRANALYPTYVALFTGAWIEINPR